MNQPPLIITTPEQIADLLRPYLDLIADEAIKEAIRRAGDAGRMVKYEEARRITGLGKTQFSRAVTDGTIPHYPNGQRGKLFKLGDLAHFKGYRPKTAAETKFEKELATRK